MKRSVFVLAAGFAVAACHEVSTAPQVADVNTAATRFSNPPPPPIEAGALTTVNVQTQSISLSRSISQQQTCEGGSLFGSFVLPVKYMFNPAGNSGWLHFESSDLDSVAADANGMVRMQDGEFFGKGEVSILIDGCELLIDLSSVDSESSFFAACGTSTEVPPGDFSSAAVPERPENGCFFVRFDEVTLDGQDVGGATMQFTARCEPGEENPNNENIYRPECNPALFEPEIIS